VEGEEHRCRSVSAPGDDGYSLPDLGGGVEEDELIRCEEELAYSWVLGRH
jgi:hypothetical protein